jgi:long-chain acyl-CoA synthetase
MLLSEDKSLLDYFYYWETQTPDAVFLKQPFGDIYKDYTWQQAGDAVRKISTFIQKQNLPACSHIAIISKNCAEWIITDLAIMQSGHVSIPLYPTLTGAQINELLIHSETKLAFIGKLDNAGEICSGIPENLPCVSFPTYNPVKNHVQWDQIISTYEPDKINKKINFDDIFTIIYTSGTTGNPKGVMFNMHAVSKFVVATREASFAERRNTRFFSYLPLCHIAERNIVEVLSLVTGGTVFFAETIESFAKNLQNARPTHFLAVPRIWTKFQLGILSKLPQKRLDLLLSIPLVKTLIKNKIKKGLGLDQAYMILTGAAPMPVSLVHWFKKFDIKIQEAYGMTENLGGVSVMPSQVSKDGSVGKLHNGGEVKIDLATGEILTKSPWTMLGYYKEPTMTAEVIDSDGWLHTGDVGQLDPEGFLKITGRVKEMYKTSKGEYVAPSAIETRLTENPIIEQVCLVGQNLPQPIALVVISDIGKHMSQFQVIDSLISQLNDLNPTLKSYEKVKKIVVMSEPWTVENFKLTPTLKIRRAIIEKDFGHLFEQWYNLKETVVFY